MTSDGSQPRDPFADTTAKAPAEAGDPFASPVKKNKPSGGKTPTAESPPTDANPFGDNMPKLELDGAEEPAGPATNIGGGLVDLLGKTLSGQTGNRDPFGAPAKEEPAPGNEPDKKAAASPPAKTPAADPFGTPAKKEPGARRRAGEESRRPAGRCADCGFSWRCATADSAARCADCGSGCASPTADSAGCRSEARPLKEAGGQGQRSFQVAVSGYSPRQTTCPSCVVRYRRPSAAASPSQTGIGTDCRASSRPSSAAMTRSSPADPPR